MRKKIFEYKIDDLVSYIISNRIDKDKILKFAEENIESTEQLELFKQNVDFAYNRMEASLDINSIIFFIIFPFGIVSMFDSSKTYDVEEYRKYGYLKKVREVYKYSLLGVLMYFSAVIIATILFK